MVLKKDMETNIKTLPMQIGQSFSADFEDKTWTFELEDNFEVSAGMFAIEPVDKWQSRTEENERMRSALEKITKIADVEIFWDERKLIREIVYNALNQ